MPLEPVPSGPGVPSAALDSSVGRTLAGRFRLLRLHRKSATGEVYEARDLFLNTTVAVKTLSAELAGSPEALERLRREVLLARRIHHPNLCRIHELHQDLTGAEPLTLLTMEFLEGETLAERLRRTGPLPPEDALGLLEQIAAGLAALHGEAIVHGALGPDAVMLVRTPKGSRAVITDWFAGQTSVPDESSEPTLPPD